MNRRGAQRRARAKSLAKPVLMHCTDSNIDRHEHTEPFDLPPLAIVQVITARAALVGAIGGFQPGFIAKMRNQAFGFMIIIAVDKNR